MAVVLGTSLAFSGCVELLVLTTEEDALQVPPMLAGERAVFETHRTGHSRSYVHDGSGNEVQVLAVDDTHRDTRTVEQGITIDDAWFRAVDVVALRYESEDLDPDEDEMHEYAWTEFYERSTRLSVAQEMGIVSVTSTGGCDLTSCGTSLSVDESVGTVFPRVRTEAEWDSLAGRALKVGETIRFERVAAAEFLGLDYREWTQYTVLREETIDGERTMVVDVTNGMDWIDPPEELKAASHDDTDEESGAGVQARAPVHLLWFSERASVPVKSEFSWPFEENGASYSTNHATRLAEYERGSEEIRWGTGTPVIPVSRLEPSESLALGELFDTRANVGRYPAGDAWQNVNDDLLLSEFRAYRAGHPDEIPTGATFLPDEDGTNYWVFDLGEGTWSDGVSVTSRQEPIVGPISMVENREEQFNSAVHSISAPTADELASTRLLSLEEAAARYAQVSDEAEPMIQVIVGHRTYVPDSPLESYAAFGQPNQLMSSSLPSSLIWDFTVASSSEPVSVDLLDGGLRGINTDLLFSIVIWSTVPGVPMEATIEPGGAARFTPIAPDPTMAALGGLAKTPR